MGEVYRALDRESGRLAALKVLRVGDPQSLERFAREEAVLAELRHPCIVSYLTHGRTADGLLYLAMAWLEGEDLGQRLTGASLGLGDVLLIAERTAGGLAAAHARGIVHRDVKPSNLFLIEWQPARATLLDFGVARLASLEPLTASGMAVGTPLYMSPEQARGARDIDARADVFALGCVIFRALTGHHPFSAGSPAELMARLFSPDAAPRV